MGGLVTGFLNGLFGSGGGTVIVPFMEEVLNTDEHKSHTAILIIFCYTLVSLFFYAKGKKLDLALAVKVSLGGIAGGILGARLLKKLSGKAIRKIFGIFMIAAAVRMFF